MASLRFPAPLHILSPRRGVRTGACRPGTDTNPYQVLGLKPGVVTERDIKRAYRDLAKRIHPDVAPAGEAEEYRKRFVELRWAYEEAMDRTAEKRGQGDGDRERVGFWRVYRRWETDQCY